MKLNPGSRPSFQFLVILLTTALSTSAIAQHIDNASVHSAFRYPHETLDQALQRYSVRLHQAGGSPAYWINAQTAAVPLPQVDFSRVPTLPSLSNMYQAFARVRDSRMIEDPNHFNTLRRLTWLFPDDGCFARAAFGAQAMKNWGYVEPAKIFIYGNLTFSTPNAPQGPVHWWYHVAPIVRIKGVPYVFDPGTDPKKPLKIDEWLAHFDFDPNQLTVSICRASAYVPASPCYMSANHFETYGLRDEQSFLNLEWERVLELGKDPTEWLTGDSPWNPSISMPSLGYVLK
ncbi:protein-glutamine glutaminase family protein [Bdellovibrionota bacterium FG-1]